MPARRATTDRRRPLVRLDYHIRHGQRVGKQPQDRKVWTRVSRMLNPEEVVCQTFIGLLGAVDLR